MYIVGLLCVLFMNKIFDRMSFLERDVVVVAVVTLLFPGMNARQETIFQIHAANLIN